MSGTIAAFARNDARGIRRDSLLIGILCGPFIYAVATFAADPLARQLRASYGFDLTEYFPLIATAFLILGPIIVLGAVGGMMLLDDKDQRTLAALRVTPIHPWSYPLYRTGSVAVAVVLSQIAAMLISPIVNVADTVAALPAMLVSGLLAAVISLLMAAWARNKVEGLAIVRAIGLIVFVLPLIAWFVTPPWNWIFGILPSFWPAQATWLGLQGHSPWMTVVGGLIYQALLAAWLTRKFVTGRI